MVATVAPNARVSGIIAGVWSADTPATAWTAPRPRGRRTTRSSSATSTGALRAPPWSRDLPHGQRFGGAQEAGVTARAPAVGAASPAPAGRRPGRHALLPGGPAGGAAHDSGVRVIHAIA
ncbi:hypothetical protein GCM10010254_16540 [Streptomyces chromofuscus]|uniref:Uncharacterized protein n=1 Tax=Streptomyces chromofuscus TaxID=42881 RepID=A0A7M2T9W0_STRCW|nr:hypothetical protein IPT68_05805 [Streptomyces chromofuscus]GGS97352.1 hypothetical protein GCM10010254_16540 [Streptomyces chromofuscus]